MINRVVLVGRLTKNPDLRYTQSGSAVASFTVAVERPFTNQNGDRDADFINCVMWRKAAENFANFTHKGAMVGIDGRLSTRNYENNQGQRVYVTEVTVDNFALLEPRSANPNNQGNFNQNAGFNNNQAFNNNAFSNANFGGAAPQQPANNAFGNENRVFESDNNVDLNSLPFASEPADSSQANVNINDQSAMSANQNQPASSADDRGDHPSIDDVPF